MSINKKAHLSSYFEVVIAISIAGLSTSCTSVPKPAPTQPSSVVVRVNSDFNSEPHDIDLFMEKGGLLLDSFGHRVSAEFLLQLAANGNEPFRVRISYQSKDGTPDSDIRMLQEQLLRNAKSEKLVIDFVTPIGSK